MPMPKMTLRQLVQDRTSLARRHAHLLETAPLLDDRGLRAIQELYRQKGDGTARYTLALAFQKAVRVDLERRLWGIRPPARLRTRFRMKQPDPGAS